MVLPTRKDMLKPEHIKALVDEQIPEGRSLDYKRGWYRLDEQKLAFLRDFSSFANTAGGHIVCGIEEKEVTNSRIKPSIPDKIVGVKWDSEVEQKRVNQCLNEWLLPRLHGYWVKSVPVEQGEVVVIYVPRSHLGPHSVRVERSNPLEFYMRTDADNVQMDYDQIRRAFLDSHGKSSEVQRFREERLMALRSGSLGIRPPDAGILLHAIPFGFPDSERSLSFTNYYRDKKIRFAQSWGKSFNNFDGFIEYGPTKNSSDVEYDCHAQLFRNGVVEISMGDLLDGDHFAVRRATLDLKKCIYKLRHYYTELELDVSISLGVCLFGMAGKSMLSGDAVDPSTGYKIPQDNIFIPEISLSTEELSVDGFKPVLDILWQTGGCASCYMFDGNGKWIGD